MALTTTAGASSRRIAAGPRGNWLLGSLLDMARDPLAFYWRAAKTYGDVVRFRMGTAVEHLLVHPDHIKHVLQDNNRNYGKQTPGFNRLRAFLGNGLVTSEGTFWLRQRRIMQPAFHRDRIASFAEVMVAATESLLESWQRLAASGQPFDIAPAMLEVSLKVVGLTLLGIDLTDKASEIGPALATVLESTEQAVTSAFPVSERIPTPHNLRFRRARRTLHRLIMDIIARHRTAPRDSGDLLSMLISARDEETGESMSDEQLRDEAMTIFIAGHETTATALSWLWYILSQHPFVVRALRAELAVVLGGRAPTFDDLPQLKYTRMVIDEAMRIYPPVWVIARSAIADDVIGGFHIPAGSLVCLNQHITHHDPRFWPNPEAFEPTRFEPDRIATVPRFAYLPFGGGQRLCIGNNFALMEMQIIVAMIAQRFELHIVPGQTIVPYPTITMRPRGGIMMTVHRA